MTPEEIYSMLPEDGKESYLKSIPDDEFIAKVPEQSPPALRSLIAQGGVTPGLAGVAFGPILGALRDNYAPDYKPGASAAIYKSSGYSPIGVTKWDEKARKHYNHFLPLAESDEPDQDQLAFRQYNEIETGMPDLELVEAVEAAGDAYDADPSSENLVDLQVKLARYDGRKKSIAALRKKALAEGKSPWQVAVDEEYNRREQSKGPGRALGRIIDNTMSALPALADDISAAFGGDEQEIKRNVMGRSLEGAIDEKIADDLDGIMGGAFSYTNDVLKSTAENAPGMAAGMLVGAATANPGLGMATSIAMSSASAGPRAYNDAISKGFSTSEAKRHAARMMAVEATTAAVFGKLTGGTVDAWAGKVLNNVRRSEFSTAGTKVGHFIKMSASEGGEELTASLTNNIIDLYGYDPVDTTEPGAYAARAWEIAKNSLYEGAVGAGAGGLMGMASVMSNAPYAIEIYGRAKNRWKDLDLRRQEGRAAEPVEVDGLVIDEDTVREAATNRSEKDKGYLNSEDSEAYIKNRRGTDQAFADAWERAEFLGITPQAFANLARNLNPQTVNQWNAVSEMWMANEIQIHHENARLIEELRKELEAIENDQSADPTADLPPIEDEIDPETTVPEQNVPETVPETAQEPPADEVLPEVPPVTEELPPEVPPVTEELPPEEMPPEAPPEVVSEVPPVEELPPEVPPVEAPPEVPQAELPPEVPPAEETAPLPLDERFPDEPSRIEGVRKLGISQREAENMSDAERQWILSQADQGLFDKKSWRNARRRKNKPWEVVEEDTGPAQDPVPPQTGDAPETAIPTPAEPEAPTQEGLPDPTEDGLGEFPLDDTPPSDPDYPVDMEDEIPNEVTEPTIDPADQDMAMQAEGLSEAEIGKMLPQERAWVLNEIQQGTFTKKAWRGAQRRKTKPWDETAPQAPPKTPPRPLPPPPTPEEMERETRRLDTKHDIPQHLDVLGALSKGVSTAADLVAEDHTPENKSIVQNGRLHRALVSSTLVELSYDKDGQRFFRIRGTPLPAGHSEVWGGGREAPARFVLEEMQKAREAAFEGLFNKYYTGKRRGERQLMRAIIKILSRGSRGLPILKTLHQPADFGFSLADGSYEVMSHELGVYSIIDKHKVVNTLLHEMVHAATAQVILARHIGVDALAYRKTGGISAFGRTSTIALAPQAAIAERGIKKLLGAFGNLVEYAQINDDYSAFSDPSEARSIIILQDREVRYAQKNTAETLAVGIGERAIRRLLALTPIEALGQHGYVEAGAQKSAWQRLGEFMKRVLGLEKSGRTVFDSLWDQFVSISESEADRTRHAGEMEEWVLNKFAGEGPVSPEVVAVRQAIWATLAGGGKRTAQEIHALSMPSSPMAEETVNLYGVQQFEAELEYLTYNGKVVREGDTYRLSQDLLDDAGITAKKRLGGTGKELPDINERAQRAVLDNGLELTHDQTNGRYSDGSGKSGQILFIRAEDAEALKNRPGVQNQDWMIGYSRTPKSIGIVTRSDIDNTMDYESADEILTSSQPGAGRVAIRIGDPTPLDPNASLAEIGNHLKSEIEVLGEVEFIESDIGTVMDSKKDIALPVEPQVRGKIGEGVSAREQLKSGDVHVSGTAMNLVTEMLESTGPLNIDQIADASEIGDRTKVQEVRDAVLAMHDAGILRGEVGEDGMMSFSVTPEADVDLSMSVVPDAPYVSGDAREYSFSFVPPSARTIGKKVTESNFWDKAKKMTQKYFTRFEDRIEPLNDATKDQSRIVAQIVQRTENQQRNLVKALREAATMDPKVHPWVDRIKFTEDGLITYETAKLLNRLMQKPDFFKKARKKDPVTGQEAMLPKNVAVELIRMRAHIRRIGKLLKNLDNVGDALKFTITQNEKIYLTRTYQKFTDPEAWRSNVEQTPEIYENLMVHWLNENFNSKEVRGQWMKQLKLRGVRNMLLLSTAERALFKAEWVTKPMSYLFQDGKLVDYSKYNLEKAKADGRPPAEMHAARMWSYVNALISKDTTGWREVSGQHATAANRVNALTERKDIPRAIRAVYGENVEVFTNYVETMYAAGTAYAQRATMDRIRKVGLAQGWLSKTNQPDMGKRVRQIDPGNKHPSLRTLGSLWADGDTADAIESAFQQPPSNMPLKVLLFMSGWSKYMATVGSPPRSTIRNFTGNALPAMWNGVNPFEAAKYLKEFQAMVMGTDDRALQAKMEFWSRLGLMEGVAMEEFKNMLAHVGRELQSFQPSSPVESPAQALLREKFGNKPVKVKRALQRGIEINQKAYNAGDFIWKIITFETYRPYYEAHTGQKATDPLKAGNRPPNATDMLIAERVRATVQTYSDAAKITRIWSKYVPFGPFVIFPAEMVRNMYNRIWIFWDEWNTPALRPLAMRRLLGAATSTVGMWAAMEVSKAILGIDDEEDEEYRRRAPPWMQNSSLLYIGGELGNRTVLDLGYNDPHAYFTNILRALTRGGPSGMFDEMLAPVTAEDLWWGEVVSIWRNADEFGRPIYSEGVGTEEQIKAAARHLIGITVPGAAKSVKRWWDAGNDPMPGAQMTEAAGILGFPRPVVIERETADMFKAFGYVRLIGSSDEAVRKAFKARNSVSLNHLRNYYMSAMKTKQRNMEDLGSYMHGSELLGAEDVLSEMQTHVSNSEDFTNAYIGLFEPYMPSDSEIQQILERPDGEERVNLLFELYNEYLDQM